MNHINGDGFQMEMNGFSTFKYLKNSDAGPLSTSKLRTALPWAVPSLLKGCLMIKSVWCLESAGATEAGWGEDWGDTEARNKIPNSIIRCPLLSMVFTGCEWRGSYWTLAGGAHVSQAITFPPWQRLGAALQEESGRHLPWKGALGRPGKAIFISPKGTHGRGQRDGENDG